MMEYVPLQLAQVLERAEPVLSAAQRLSLMRDVAEGVQYLAEHQVGIIVHGDIKPANVLVTFPGLRAKLCDFGLSAVKKTVSTMSTMGAGAGAVGGTVNWCAPEMFKPKPKKRSPGDIWSLGLVVWQLMLEKDEVPFQAMPSMIKQELTSPHFTAADHFPLAEDDMAAEEDAEIEAFDHVHAFLVDRCWTVDPLRRAKAAEVTAALLAISQKTGLQIEEEKPLAAQPDHQPDHPAPGVVERRLFVDVVGQGTGVVDPLLVIGMIDDTTSFQAVKDRVRDHLDDAFPGFSFKKIGFVLESGDTVPAKDLNTGQHRDLNTVLRCPAVSSAEEEHGAGALRLLLKLWEGTTLPAEMVGVQREHRRLQQQHREKSPGK
jgi:serine/threonine protein kinase